MFLSCHCGFTNYFEILNFVFSNIIPREISTSTILTFQDSTSRNIKLKNCKIQSFSLFSWFFFWNFALITYGTLKIMLLSVQNYFYFTLSSYVQEHVKNSSSLNFMSSVGFQTSKIGMFFGKIYCGTSFKIIFRQKWFSRALCFFYFLTVFHMVWKTKESCELPLWIYLLLWNTNFCFF